jgi:hypothetical protein
MWPGALDGAPRDLNQDERNALSGATTDVEPVGPITFFLDGIS